MRFLLLFFLTLLCTIAEAQDNTVVFRLGTGTYSMKSQKSFQAAFRKESGLPLRTVDDFPPFLSFGGALGFKTARWSALGVWLEYSSTGGRLHYADYSGEAQLDQLLNYFQVGMYYQYQLSKSSSWPLFFTTHASVITTQATFNSKITVDTQTQSEKIELKGTNFGLRPSLMLQRKISMIVLQASVGFELQTHGDMKGEDGSTLAGNDGKKAQWDGFRGGIAAGFVLSSKKADH